LVEREKDVVLVVVVAVIVVKVGGWVEIVILGVNVAGIVVAMNFVNLIVGRNVVVGVNVGFVDILG
jgi:hypothetical protein